MASICCSPPESVPAICLRRSLRREALVDVRNARFNGGVRLGVSAHFEVILDRHLQKDVAAFRNLRKTVLDDLVRGDAL